MTPAYQRFHTTDVTGHQIHLGLESQLRKFAQSALHIGLSQDEVIEAVIQTGPYSGFPRALNGLAILTEVFPKD